VRLGGFVPIDAIPHLIAAADLGVVPMRQNLFTDLAHSTKAFEYIVMGVPVIVSHTRAMAELFPGVPEMFFRPDDVEDLARHILALYRDPARRHRLLDAARQAYGSYTWEIKGQEYLDLMRRLAMRAEQAPKLEQY
jgi:glycosyltransferase involved in cell wall biosynthesis